MAEVAKITVNDLRMLEVDANPNGGGGVAAPVGSLAMNNSTGGLWKKTAAGDTSWTEIGGGGTSPLVRITNATTITSVATLDITGLTTGHIYIIRYWNAAPASDGADFQIRTSTDGGSTFDTAGNYSYAVNRVISNGTNSPFGSTGNGQMGLATPVEGAASPLRYHSGELMFFELSGTTQDKAVFSDIIHHDSAGTNMHRATGAGRHKAAADIDAVRLMYSSGNIAQMTYAVYRLEVS